MSDATPIEARSKALTDFGWHVEMTDDGDVRLRRSALWRGAQIGCSFGILVLFSRLFGWRSEHEFGAARWKLARAFRSSSTFSIKSE